MLPEKAVTSREQDAGQPRFLLPDFVPQERGSICLP
jgi:hypothetical protein